jgi:hypothetical protein
MQIDPLVSSSATVDHLYTVFHPFRQKKARQRAGFRRNALLYVLACWRCNKERGHVEQGKQVFIPKLPHRVELAASVSANRVVD